MVSRITWWMIQANDVEIVTTDKRHEVWTVKNGNLHALMLSAPLDKLAELESFVKEAKAGTL